MGQPKLRPIKKGESVMPIRKCGHPGGMTLDFLDAKKDGSVIATSFCMGCFRDKFNKLLKQFNIEEWKPVAQYTIKDNKVTQIWGD
jgi:hypothetical protein